MLTFRLAGFRVVIGPVWLAGAALLVVSLVATLPLGAAPTISGATSLAVAAFDAVLLVILIVGLELARAIAARRRGAPPAEVRILTVGVPPPPETPPTSPLTEMVVATTAPLSGGLIGAAILSLGRLVDGNGDGAATALHWGLTWLGLGVLVIAAFVSLPLLPLDGGRLVRAIAWRITGDLARATRIASAVGRGFGYLVLGSGLVATFMGELIIGLWLLLLGWLATRVARGSADRERLQELTAGLTVDDAIDAEAATIGAALTLDALLTQAEQPDARSVYPVVVDDRLAGVVFVGRITRRARRRASELRAADVMVPLDRLRLLRSGDPLFEAVIRLDGGRVDAFPVAAADDPARLIGIVTRDRVLERLRARQALQSARTGHAGRAAGG